jgi:hypothetical protein
VIITATLRHYTVSAFLTVRARLPGNAKPSYRSAGLLRSRPVMPTVQTSTDVLGQRAFRLRTSTVSLLTASSWFRGELAGSSLPFATAPNSTREVTVPGSLSQGVDPSCSSAVSSTGGCCVRAASHGQRSAGGKRNRRWRVH